LLSGTGRRVNALLVLGHLYYAWDHKEDDTGAY
jgi:hypothetical protein